MAEQDNYWTALDGLRGVAVAMVILYHFGAPIGSGGYLGVDLFFVISGCVVTASLRRSMARGNTLSHFFLRRVARLLPNLLLLLLVVLAWNTWDEGDFFTTRNAAVLAGLTQTYNIFTASNGLATLHLWSLSMEWQFYLLLPLLLPVFCVRGLSSGVRWAVCTAVMSIALRPILERVFGVSQGHIYLWPVTRLDDLMLGVAVALLVGQGRRLSIRGLSGTATWGLVGALLFAPRWFRDPDQSLFFVMPLVAAAGFVVVWSIVSSGPDAPLNRFLSLPVLRYVGERSYSIYLWHYFVGVALIARGESWQGPMVFAVQVAVSLVVAIAAYEWIELPARTYLNELIAENHQHRRALPA